MKKKLKDITIKEAKHICSSMTQCAECPFDLEDYGCPFKEHGIPESISDNELETEVEL